MTAQLKKMNLQEIKGIEEVNLFKENDEIIHITEPKCTFHFLLVLVGYLLLLPNRVFCIMILFLLM